MRLALALLIPTLALPAERGRLSFVRDIVPILTKSGCAGSTCHGSIRGQAGFKLSLFGYEPETDFDAITKAADGHRIDRAKPENSLVLMKPSFRKPHGGGERFKPGSLEYNAILQWIREGAQFDSPGSPRIQSIRVSPDSVTLAGLGKTFKLSVIATYSDGEKEDVSRKVQYTPQDETVAEVSPAGEVKAMRTGETPVMIRTLGKAVAVTVAVVDTRAKAPMPALQPNNFIDEKVFAKLRRLNIRPSNLSTDAEFLRRVYLDTTGVLPTIEETLAYTSTTDPRKRSKLIDRLLLRPEHAELWATRLADLLRLGAGVGPKPSRDMYAYLRQSVLDDKPYNQLATEIITSSGNVARNPLASFYRTGEVADPAEIATAVSQVFLSTRLECARCHNHPWEKWTQDDFWAFASFFGRLEFKSTIGEPLVSFNDKSEVIHPRTKKPASPKYLDGPQETEGPDEDIREKLAAWITASTNPWFARGLVNRVWKHYMGRGIVEPIDDFRVTNPPTNPALLDALAADFIAHGYSLRHLSSVILNSRTYQLSSVFNDSNHQDTRNYASYYPKRLLAEELMDGLSQVAEDREVYPGQKPGTRAINIPAFSENYFLQTFGRTMQREKICERDDTPAMTQAMHLISGDTLQKKLTAKNGVLDRALQDPYLTDQAIVERLYFSSLVRPPSERELEIALQPIREKGKTARKAAFEDLLWALFNSKEFLYNH